MQPPLHEGSNSSVPVQPTARRRSTWTSVDLIREQGDDDDDDTRDTHGTHDTHDAHDTNGTHGIHDNDFSISTRENGEQNAEIDCRNIFDGEFYDAEDRRWVCQE